MGRRVARRLLDLSAADVDALGRLPGTRVSSISSGETTITFDEHVVLRGIISSGTAQGRRPNSADHANLVITTMGVVGSDR